MYPILFAKCSINTNGSSTLSSIFLASLLSLLQLHAVIIFSCMSVYFSSSWGSWGIFVVSTKVEIVPYVEIWRFVTSWDVGLNRNFDTALIIWCQWRARCDGMRTRNEALVDFAGSTETPRINEIQFVSRAWACLQTFYVRVCMYSR